MKEVLEAVARGEYSKGPPPDPAFRTDEETELARALEKLADQLELATDDAYEWKWAIVALHNASQAACVVAVSETDQAGAVTDPKVEREWLRAFLDGNVDASSAPDPHLASFLVLYKRAKALGGAVIPPELDDDMTRLNVFRNVLIHFVPKTWALLLLGMPELVLRVLAFIESIMPGSAARGGVPFGDEENDERARDGIRRSREAARALQAHFKEAIEQREGLQSSGGKGEHGGASLGDSPVED